jgi:glutamate racemase
VREILSKKSLLSDRKNKAPLKFYVSDNPKKFAKIGSRFFSKKIKSATKTDLEKFCAI